MVTERANRADVLCFPLSSTSMLIAFASLQQPAFVAWPALAEIRTTRRVSDAMMVSLNNIKLSSRDNGDDDDDFTDEETESLFFNFDVDGNPRAGSIKPHLRTMVDAVKSNSALLLDARPLNEHARLSRPDALHVGPLADGSLPAQLKALLPDQSSLPLYVFSSFEDPDSAECASKLLQAAGFTDVRTLEESFEALQAQCPA